MTRQKRKTTSRRVPPKKRNEKHITLFLFGIFLFVNLFLGSLLFGLVHLDIPDIKNVVQYRPYQTSYILDTRGNIVEKIYVENRRVVPFSKMPELLVKAFVAAEDGKFYEHPGLDVVSVLRAAFNNIRQGRNGQGGSTITQQVAKSLLLTPEKTYLRKFKEAILALRIDTLFSKEDILYIYLNQIYLGGGAHGVEAASQVYFNKHVWELNLSEMAVLAGLPQAPSRYSPLKHPERAALRQKYVLNRMAADGYITSEQARAAYAVKLNYATQSKPVSNRQVGYYTQVVKKQAEKILGMPLTQAAVTVRTSLDVDMQMAAINSLRKGVLNVAKRAGTASPQGALVTIDTCSGQVLALAGGTDYVTYPFNRAVQARRPAGSVFKPLIYAAALQHGLKKDSMISDSPLSITGSGGKVWKPKNFSGKYHGAVSLVESLAHSYNIPAIRLLQQTGVKAVHELAKNAGITSPLTADLSLALGTVDVSPLEMTAAYSPYVCSGHYVEPRFIKSIHDAQGKLIYSSQKKSRRIMSAKVSSDIQFMLRKVVLEGTGKAVRGLGREVGGKTGTTNHNRDVWFIGFDGRSVTGVWIGHDRNMSLGKYESGGHTAAPVWLDYMKKIKR